jgi:hypothetical protein
MKNTNISIDLRKNSGRRTMGIVALIIICYILFFTSRIWLEPYDSHIKATEKSRIISVGNLKMSLIDWIYEKDTNEMLIILSVENRELGLLDQHLTFLANVSSEKKKVGIEIVNSSDYYYFIKLYDIPRDYDYVTFNIVYQGRDVLRNQITTYRQNIVTTYSKVTRGEIIEYATNEEYFNTYLDYKLRAIEQEIEVLVEQNKEYEEAKKRYREINASALESNINSLQTTINRNNASIAVLEKREKLLNEKR